MAPAYAAVAHGRRALTSGDTGYRVHTSAAIAAGVGFTWFAAWLITDATGPHRLDSLSLLATAVFLATGAILAGYAGWIGGP